MSSSRSAQRGQGARALGLALALVATAAGRPARAENVGLGIAGGLSYSPTRLQRGQLVRVGSSVLWGFVVDVPLLPSFALMPMTVLYRVDLGQGSTIATDLDLNFKFILPLGVTRLGLGVTTGLTSTVAYDVHVGALAYLGLALTDSVDGFAMLQYKRLMLEVDHVDLTHGMAGLLFRF